MSFDGVQPGIENAVVRKAPVKLFGQLQGLRQLVGVQAQAYGALGLVAFRLTACNQLVQRITGNRTLADIKSQVGHQRPVTGIENATGATGALSAKPGRLQRPQCQRQVALLQVQVSQAQCVFLGQARQPKLLQDDDSFFGSPGLLKQLGFDSQQAGHAIRVATGCLCPRLAHKRQRGIHRTQTLVHLNDLVHLRGAQAALARQGQPGGQQGRIVIDHRTQAKHVGQGFLIRPSLHQFKPGGQRQRGQSRPLGHLGFAFQPQRVLRLRQQGGVSDLERCWQIVGGGKGCPGHLQALCRQGLGQRGSTGIERHDIAQGPRRLAWLGRPQRQLGQPPPGGVRGGVCRIQRL